MSVEYKKALVRRFLDEYLNEEDRDTRYQVADEIMAIDFVDHTNPPDLQRGLESHKQVISILRTAFPDLHWQYEEPIAEGDKVIIRVMMSGTHQGEFFGIAPTGKQVRVKGFHILRITDGEIAEHWSNHDGLDLMQQLKASPGLA
jgi:predicted ester cyclase